MITRKKVYRWYWAWNNKNEERWLEQMARSGWHLVGGPFPYIFEQGAPVEARYRMDYPSQDADKGEYLRLYRDSGWERVFEFAGWQYFSTTSPEAPEIYTDSASRIAMFRRLLGVCVVLFLCTMTGNMFTLFDHSAGSHAHIVMREFLRWVVVALLCMWVYIIARLLIHIRKLKRLSRISTLNEARD